MNVEVSTVAVDDRECFVTPLREMDGHRSRKRAGREHRRKSCPKFAFQAIARAFDGGYFAGDFSALAVGCDTTTRTNVDRSI